MISASIRHPSPKARRLSAAATAENENAPDPGLPRTQGFALVLALGLMAFVLLLMLGMSAIVRVETTAANAQMETLRAKCNALLGMQIAIGRLQQTTGPDRRVTATAEITGEQPRTDIAAWLEEWEGRNPHWVGVWREGRAVDQLLLNPNPDGPKAMPRDPIFEGWLVSAADTTTLDPTAEASADSVVLLSEAGAGGDPAADDVPGSVHVPAVRIPAEEGLQSGRFAYWVADEGVKARINISETGEDDFSVEPTQNIEAIWTLRSPPSSGWKSLEYFDDADADDATIDSNLGRSHSLADLEIWAESDAEVPSFHNFSTFSLGLLTDTRRGGYRSDLSYFVAQPEDSVEVGPEEWDIVEGEEAPSEAYLDDLTLVRVGGDYEDRHFLYLEHEEHVHGSDVWQYLIPEWEGDAYAANAAIEVMPPNDEGQGIHPVMAGASIYFDFTRTEDNRLRLHIFPAYLIWNPYDVAFEASNYVLTQRLDFDIHLDLRVGRDLPSGRTWQSVNVEDYSPLDINAMSGGLEEDETATFNVKDLRLEPGEVAVLTPAAFAMPFTNETDSNLLEPSSANAWNDLNSFTLDTDIVLPDWPQFYQVRYLHTRRGADADDTFYLDPKLFVETDDEEEPQILTHLRLFFMRLPSDLTGFKEPDQEYAFPWYDINEGSVQRGRMVPVESGGGWHEFDLAGIFRGPFNETQHPDGDGSLAIRYLANYNLREPYHYRNQSELVGWDLILGVPTLNRDEHVGESTGAVLDNFASPAHPTNFLGPFFEVFRSHEELLSVGQLQHMNWGSAIWHPAYALGNSLAPPSLSREDIRTSRLDGKGEGQIDLSYLVNEALFDRYYFSTLPQSGAYDLDADFRLPNSRYRLLDTTTEDGSEVNIEDLRGLKSAARHLGVFGAFNVNSTRVDAWAALLGSFRDVEVPLADNSSDNPAADGYPHPYPRTSRPLLSHLRSGGSTGGGDTSNDHAYRGYRALSDTEVDDLAEQIVEQVRRRGPFLSLAEFVNRLPVHDTDPDADLGLMGALQAAINAAGINAGFDDEVITVAPGATPTQDTDTAREVAEHVAGAKGTNLPGYLSQSDLLQSLAPVLSARSDTFTIRSFGSSESALGPEHRVFLEAVVQRLPDPEQEDGFGRPYRIVSFRWIAEDEI